MLYTVITRFLFVCLCSLFFVFQHYLFECVFRCPFAFRFTHYFVYERFIYNKQQQIYVLTEYNDSQ